MATATSKMIQRRRNTGWQNRHKWDLHVTWFCVFCLFVFFPLGKRLRLARVRLPQQQDQPKFPYNHSFPVGHPAAILRVVPKCALIVQWWMCFCSIGDLWLFKSLPLNYVFFFFNRAAVIFLNWCESKCVTCLNKIINYPSAVFPKLPWWLTHMCCLC